jgi:proline iminopeptidase
LAAAGFSEHRVYWEEYGSLAGEPVIVMHGGPGAGSHISSARFFDPQRYRVVLFDQRGCGKSTPSASDDDATPALTDNTTQHLIDDVSALRHELNINGKMHVFGGSWGSTLALAYAIVHPTTVQTLILRGVFLCRRADVDYFFQGNAAEFRDRPARHAGAWRLSGFFRRLGGISSTSFRRKIAAMSSRGWLRPSPCHRGPTKNGSAW